VVGTADAADVSTSVLGSDREHPTPVGRLGSGSLDRPNDVNAALVDDRPPVAGNRRPLTGGFRRSPRRAAGMSGFDGFEVIPAVDVQDGEVVQLIQGERGTEKRYGDPTEAARRWVEAGAHTLHLVDLDGAFEGERRNAAAVDAILEATDDDVGVQLGGGIRSASEAIELLERGVDRAILGTAAVESPGIVEEIAERYPEGVAVSLDARDGEVVVSGWTEGTGLDPAEAAARYEELGAGAILFTNVDVEGRLEGVRSEPVRRIAEAVSIPVIASGGVASVEDVRALREAGAAAVVVGSALYEGRFTLAEAAAAVE
jgi:phosphoribosylformimino-5-aminoimidazole carboxamide ribotide isomerase